MAELEKTEPKKRTRRLLWRIAFSFLLLSFLLTVFLPMGAAFAVRRILQGSLKLGTAECDISQIGLFQANLAFSLRAAPGQDGKPGRRVLNLPHCRLSYRPWALLRGRIDRVDIIGATVQLVYENGKITLPVAEVFASAEKKPEAKKSAKGSFFEALPNIGEIRIQNAGLMFRYGKRMNYLPLSFAFGQGRNGWRDPFARGSVQWNGNAVFLRNLTCDLKEMVFTGEVVLYDFQLGLLPPSLDRAVSASRLSGAVDAKLKFRYRQSENLMEGLDFSGAVRNFSCVAGGVPLAAEKLPFSLRHQGMKGEFTMGRLQIVGMDELKSVTWKYVFPTWKTFDGRLAFAFEKFGVPAFRIQADFAGKKVGVALDSPYLLRSPALELAAFSLSLHYADGLSGEAALRLSQAAFPGVALKDFSFRQPFEQGKMTIGEFSLGELAYAKDPVCRVSGSTALNLARLNEKVAFALSSQVEPLSEKMKFSGSVGLSCDWPFRGARSVTLRLEGVSAELAPQKLRVSGLDLLFVLPDFPRLRSAPGQEIRIGSFVSGKCELEDFHAAFRMDSPKDWTLENFRTRWADGTVRLESVRFAPGAEPEFTLHCDRVNIGQALSQLGIPYADGQGALSGTLPVTLRRGRPVFGEGFLGTTPGISGEVRFGGTELLTAGVPKSSPYYAQLHFSQEALKEFEYQWAKIGFANRGRKLQLQLQLEGRPVRPLPYRYENGRFIAVDGLVRSGGVRLDINFTLPFEAIWNLSEKIQKIKKGILK